MKRALAGLAVPIALAVSPAPAAAAVLGFVEGHYVYVADDGEANDLRITYSGGRVSLDDDYAIAFDGSLAGRNCEHPFEGTASEEPDKASCDFAAEPLVGLGDQNDHFLGDITTAGGSELVDGGPGEDVLKGGFGDDLLEGGPGKDLFEKGGPEVRAGSDEIVGGDDIDEIWYTGDYSTGGSEAVRVTLDGVANDGPASQSDNVQVESVRGGERDDVLIGGPGPDKLLGVEGNDELRGGAGNDALDGASGDDRVYGDEGDDEVRGGSNASDDLLDGGPGQDELIGDDPCVFYGCQEGGEDQINARDGTRDVIRCGGGQDSAVIDELDVFAEGGGTCETLDRPAPAAPPAPAPAGPGGAVPGGGMTLAAPSLAAPVRTTAAALARRGLAITVTCGGACTIDAGLFIPAATAREIGLGAKRVRIGRARSTLTAPGTRRLRVRLTARARRAIRRVRRATATLEVRVAQAGTTRTLKRRLKVGR